MKLKRPLVETHEVETEPAVKTASDLLIEMETRREYLISKAIKERSSWLDAAVKAEAEKEEYEGIPEKLDDYVLADNKEKVANSNIDKLNDFLMKLRQRKVPLAKPEESEQFYGCVYEEALTEAKELATAFLEHYKMLRDISSKIQEVSEKANRIVNSWDHTIALEECKDKVFGMFQIPGTAALDVDNGYSAIPYYDSILWRIENAFKSISSELDRIQH